jgi:hypothetical protein
METEKEIEITQNGQPEGQIAQEGGIDRSEVEPKRDGMSQREAIRAAIAQHGDPSDTMNDGTARGGKPTPVQVKDAIDDEVAPPAAFSAEAKEAWRNKDYKRVNQEYDRLFRARDQEVGRVHTRERQLEQENKTIKELADKVKSYLAVRGDEAPDEMKIVQALQLVNELRKGDAASVKAELKKAGIDLDKAVAQTNQPEEKITTLQERLERLERDKETQVYEKAVQTFGAVYQKLSSQKNRTGDPVFPDLLDDSPSGIQFGHDLGSLTQDPKFQAGVLRRFPDADLVTVTREAYKYLGGRVAGEVAKESPKSNQQHIIQSRRAAASTPGRATSTKSSSDLIGKLSRKAAIRAAIAESEGH